MAQPLGIGLGANTYHPNAGALHAGAVYPAVVANNAGVYANAYQEAYKQSKIQQLKQLLGWEEKQRHYLRLRVLDRGGIATNPKIVLAAQLSDIYGLLITQWFGAGFRVEIFLTTQYSESAAGRLPFEEGLAQAANIVFTVLKAEENAAISAFPIIEDVGT